VFRHVVCFRWKDGTTDDDVNRFADMLAALPAVIPELRRYEFGRDVGRSEGNFDFAVVADFEDPTGWDAYQQHPDHRRVLEYVRTLLGERAAVQFDV
jgi:Stress responsive A/B Barrel Domain